MLIVLVQKIMENEPHMQLDHYNRMPIIMDGPSPQLLSESHLRSSFFQQSSQSDRIIGFPVGQSYKDLHTDKSVIYDGLNRNNMNYQDLCLGNPAFPPGSLLTSRNYPDNAVVPLQDVSSESLHAMYSNSGSYASTSLVPASPNCGYDGLIGDLNNRWDQNRFLMQSEMNWRTSNSCMEPIQFNEVQNLSDWSLPNSNVCSSHGYGTSRSYSELSLSLATSDQSLQCNRSIQDQCNDLNYSSFIQHSQHHQARLGTERNSQHSQHKELSLGCNSNRSQFTEVISGSRYRSVLQQILTEIASYSLEGVDETSFSSSGNLMNSSSHHPFSSNHMFDPPSSSKGTDESSENDGSMEAQVGSSCSKRELESKRSQLLSLLQVVDDRYNQCLDQIHTVITAFHAATELDPQLHACFALQSVSFFYKGLRERISNQILAMGMESEGGGESRRPFEKSFIQKQCVIQQMKRKDQQLWRPQRGLPERSVSVLRSWMFDNFLHPYPKDAEKHLLAIKSGLTRSQVSNWFINARVRLWKPLVEEMCSELNRRKGNRQLDYEGHNNNNGSSHQLSIYDFNQRLNS